MSINYETGLPRKLGKSPFQINYRLSQKNSSETRKHKNPKTVRNRTFGPPCGLGLAISTGQRRRRQIMKLDSLESLASLLSR